MGTTKTQVESDTTQASTTPATEQLRPESEQHIGPVHAQRTSTVSPPPPPTGASSAEGGNGNIQFPPDASQVYRSQVTRGIQRSAGNAHMTRMLAGVQAKLSVSNPGDRYEQEADEAASRVVSGQTVAAISQISTGRIAAPLSRQPDEDEPPLDTPKADAETTEGVQAKPEPGGAGMVEDSGVEARIKSPGGGRPLPDGVRAEMEAGLGTDFSSVRVHDTSLDQSDARSLGAKAFTHNDHIWLGSGASVGDRKLMAHELTHVVQQGGAVRRKAEPDSPGHMEAGSGAEGANQTYSLPLSPDSTALVPEQPEGGAFESREGDIRQDGFAQFDQMEMPAVAENDSALQNEPPMLLATDATSIEALAAANVVNTAASPSVMSLPAPGVGEVRAPGISGIQMPSVGEAAGPAPQPGSVNAVVQREDEDGGLLGGIRQRINSVVEGLSSGWGRLSEMAQVAVDGIRSQLGAIADGLSGLISAAVSTLLDTWSSIGQTATQLTDGISNQVRTAMDSASGVVNDMGDAIIRMDGDALRSAWNRITGFIGNIRQALQQSVQRVFQRIVGLWQALRERFNGVLRRLASGVRAVFSRLQSAVQGLRQRMQSAWDALQNRASQLSGVLGGILDRLRSLVSRLVSWGQRIWDGIRSGWNALRDRVSGFVVQVRERFSGLWQSLRERAMSLWNRLGEQWQRLQQWVRGQVSGLMSRVLTIWNELTGFDIGSVIDAIIRYAPFLSAVREVAQNPDSVMQPMAASIASTIDAGMPAAAEDQARQAMSGQGGETVPTESMEGGVAIQRSPDDAFIQRVILQRPLDGPTIWLGLKTVLAAIWADFKSDLVGNILTMLYELIAVWDTIPRDLQGLVDDLVLVVGRMRTAGMGFWRHLIDIPLIILRRVNAILLHLYPWFVIISTVLGALAGAGLLGAAGGVILGFFSGGAGAAPGAVAGGGIGAAGGAGLGLGFALGVGEGLLASYVAGEVLSIAKAWADLYFVEQTEDEQAEDLVQMVTSAIGAGIAILLFLISAIGARLARGLMARLTPGSAAHRFVTGLGRGFRRGSPFRRTPGTRGGETETPAPGGRETEHVPGLYESIDPATPPEGYVFADNIQTMPSGEIQVRTNVTAPDGTTGNMTRGYNPATGEYIYHSAFLDGIPKPLRMVATEPEMLPGRGTPLEAYMSMRQMRILQTEAGIAGELPFAAPRDVHMSTIINTRTIAQLAVAEYGGTPLNEAIINTHSVQYANNSIVQGGGRIASARVSGGWRVAASSELTPTALERSGLPADYLQQNGVPLDYQVLSAFDIDLQVVPAGTPGGGGAPPPPPPGVPPAVPQPPENDEQ